MKKLGQQIRKNVTNFAAKTGTNFRKKVAEIPGKSGTEMCGKMRQKCAQMDQKLEPKMAPVLGTKNGPQNGPQTCQNLPNLGQTLYHFCPPKLEPNLTPNFQNLP